MDRNRLVIILGALVLALFIFNIASCANAYSKDSLRKKEILQRMEIEEKISKSAQDSAILSQKLKAAQKELDDEIAAHQATKKALIQEQMIVQSLKDDLQKVNKLKEALEEELRKSSSNKKAKK
jgi:septal ring factor EnvC (AmiA/AmiB activator)